MRKKLIKLLVWLLDKVRNDDLNNGFEMENQPCYNKEGKFIGWFSRSMAVAGFVYCKDRRGNLYVLASERGKGAADFQGYWNCTCGYLSFHETLKDACFREIHEETGVDLTNEGSCQIVGINDRLNANKQNVTVHFRIVIINKTIENFKFSHDFNDGKDEVGEIKWIAIDEIDNYNWAFNHRQLIKDYSIDLYQ